MSGFISVTCKDHSYSPPAIYKRIISLDIISAIEPYLNDQGGEYDDEGTIIGCHIVLNKRISVTDINGQTIILDEIDCLESIDDIENKLEELRPSFL